MNPTIAEKEKTPRPRPPPQHQQKHEQEQQGTVIKNRIYELRGRKRSDSLSSTSKTDSPKKEGRGERLVSRGRNHATVGTSFGSGSEEISASVVEKPPGPTFTRAIFAPIFLLSLRSNPVSEFNPV